MPSTRSALKQFFRGSCASWTARRVWMNTRAVWKTFRSLERPGHVRGARFGGEGGLRDAPVAYPASLEEVQHELSEAEEAKRGLVILSTFVLANADTHVWLPTVLCLWPA